MFFADFAVLVSLLSVGGCATIFVQKRATVTIPPDFPVGAPIHHLVAIDDVTGRKPESPAFVITRISSSPASGNESLLRSIFSLDLHSSDILLPPHHKDGALGDYKGSTITMGIRSGFSKKDRNSVMDLVVRVLNETSEENGKEFCKPKKDLCFAYSESRFLVPEITERGTIIAKLKPLSLGHLCPGISHSYSIRPKGPVDIHQSSGEMELVENLDYETEVSYTFNVSCQITHELGQSSVSAIFTKNILLVVKDVNDNPPHLQNRTKALVELDSFDVKPGKPLPVQFTVLDADSKSANNITISLEDPEDLFYTRKPVYFYNVSGGKMLVNTAAIARKPFHFSGPSYKFSLTFDDKSLITKNNSKVTFQVKIVNKSFDIENLIDVPLDEELFINVSRYATRHSRVMQPLKVRQEEGFSFRLIPDPGEDRKDHENIFAMTPRTGIVYVKNSSALSSSPRTQFRFNVIWSRGRSADRNNTIVVAVGDTDDRGSLCGNNRDNLATCAVHSNEKSCVGSCGHGSPDGPCRWRNHHSTVQLSSQYATCTPDLGNCPDGHCDELEELDGALCPQDCATTVNGGFMNYFDKGIYMAAAPCTCNNKGTCTCTERGLLPPELPDRQLKTMEKKRGNQQPRRTQETQLNRTVAPSVGTEVKQSNGGRQSICDEGCIGMIAVVSVIVTSLVVLAVVVVFRQVRQSRTEKHKYVAGRMPLTAVGSDYVDDRVQQSVETSTEDGPIDPKWEFRRDRLILQELLGEGEFGKVVKAQAWNVANRPGYSTVAVKTLKENATLAEEQDLLSELSLLRDVSHPNVIQLLGACTSKGGPIYVIVEYAELGSLRNYLRNLRQCSANGVAVSTNFAVNNPSYFETGDVCCDSSTGSPVNGNFCRQSHQSTMKELFSFAWQTAKGMAYLSDMKFVHRDLAARNILLAKNKVVKISDFGLSRDVYEGDTYLKTTRGRVPVKWLAIESLEDHIYTIKSDVWSYGIVLWEIITLGASPYPGITPERLYHLLKGGYRMPKPDNCPAELYRIMRKCWREVPQERPCFKELVANLDKLLQDTVEYLPLGPEEMSSPPAPPSEEEPGTSSQQDQRPIESTTGSLSSSPQSKENSTSVQSKGRKPSSLHFPSADEKEYESRRLLPCSPEDSSGCDASG